MEWQHPESLFLILPLCVGWFVLALYSDRRRQKARAVFAAQAMWSRIYPDEARWRFWLKLMLRELAIVMGLVALAGPRFGVQYEQVIPRGADLYVLIDVSRSMLADDVPPSRLGRAKADVSSLLNRLQGERVGLIAFAGQAVVKCPLTIDYDSFRRSLDELDPDSAPRGGTAIGDAIRKGLEVFHANADRDQAMLLITDGDDQQSYPLEAASVANERHVTIFTIGLGDAERGARVPQKGTSKTFLEYQGEQVWSKLDSNLLEQIALKTSGIYIPAGTRAYDLGELYTNHLQGRQGNSGASQQRIRRSERFQIFLALALAALLFDLCILPHRRSSSRLSAGSNETTGSTSKVSRKSRSTSKVGTIISALLLSHWYGFETTCSCAEPGTTVREGLKLYSQEKFEEAREKFASANEELEKQKSAAAAIAAFDEACAAHRKGDLERARESYLRAGLSQDRSVATSAHFNLGTLAAEKARTLCGDKPEQVPPDKRQEILDQLTQAIAAYRHCLELQSDHLPSRRNIELVRQWIKYYTDRWREIDRQKRRDESNLLQFLEFIAQTQTALRESVKRLPENVHPDMFAELKRAQEELREEIPTLREKIGRDLRPQSDPQAGAAKADDKELEEGIKMLQSWADTASEKMSAASQRLRAKEPGKTIVDQQEAIDELDKIWDVVIPFQPLLTKDLADQTGITSTLKPQNAVSPDAEKKNSDSENVEEPKPTDENSEKPEQKSAEVKPQQLEIADDDFELLEEIQSKTLKRTRMLGPKAEMELQRLESHPAAAKTEEQVQPDASSGASQPGGVDPEQAKAGFRKAIELAPQAAEKMEAAVKSMKQKDRVGAAQHSEDARKILEEIQQAQPKNEQKQDQNQQDQQQNKDQQNKQGEDQKQNEKKQDEPKDQKKQEDDKQQKPDPNKQQPQVSQDRVEEALRKVRERQQEKRERDRKLKGQFFGKTPVDKDW